MQCYAVLRYDKTLIKPCHRCDSLNWVIGANQNWDQAHRIDSSVVNGLRMPSWYLLNLCSRWLLWSSMRCATLHHPCGSRHLQARGSTCIPATYPHTTLHCDESGLGMTGNGSNWWSAFCWLQGPWCQNVQLLEAQGLSTKWVSARCRMQRKPRIFWGSFARLRIIWRHVPDRRIQSVSPVARQPCPSCEEGWEFECWSWCISRLRPSTLSQCNTAASMSQPLHQQLLSPIIYPCCRTWVCLCSWSSSDMVSFSWLQHIRSIQPSVGSGVRNSGTGPLNWDWSRWKSSRMQAHSNTKCISIISITFELISLFAPEIRHKCNVNNASRLRCWWALSWATCRRRPKAQGRFLSSPWRHSLRRAVGRGLGDRRLNLRCGLIESRVLNSLKGAEPVGEIFRDEATGTFTLKNTTVTWDLKTLDRNHCIDRLPIPPGHRGLGQATGWCGSQVYLRV